MHHYTHPTNLLLKGVSLRHPSQAKTNSLLQDNGIFVVELTSAPLYGLFHNSPIMALINLACQVPKKFLKPDIFSKQFINWIKKMSIKINFSFSNVVIFSPSSLSFSLCHSWDSQIFTYSNSSIFEGSNLSSLLLRTFSNCQQHWWPPFLSTSSVLSWSFPKRSADSYLSVCPHLPW